MSDYGLQYQTLLKVFPRKNILVVNGELLVTNPLEEVRRVESFLGLPPFFRDQHFVYKEKWGRFPCFKLERKLRCMGSDKGRKHPQLQEKTISHLRRHFRPKMEAFEEETGVGFDL